MSSTRHGVTVRPAPHGANAVTAIKPSQREYEKIRNDHIIQASVSDAGDGIQYLGARNGFVNTAVLAYSDHHHLVLRPEDIWFSVLVQLNLYINEHAEDLRSMFVAHEDQMDLRLEARNKEITGNALWGVDWAKFAYQIGKKIEEKIVDPSLREWFMPAFSTTTKSDQATASIIMMSAMQKYFSYTCTIRCGLPSVHLQGRREDWEKILGRLERLKTFGDEPTRWYELLKPVFKMFMKSFDAPESEEVRDFWQKIAHYSGGGSGPTYLSGWITAFCFWDRQGKCFHKPGQNPAAENTMPNMGQATPVLCLDNARYHRIETGDVPAGWTSVPVDLDDNGVITKAAMVAGSIGMKISSSGMELHSRNGETGVDTVQPMSGWWIYETKTEDELLEEKRVANEEIRRMFLDY